MKDLYTFDVDSISALESYDQVQLAYQRIFDSIGIPVTVAEADSGAIGGSKSHEYHFKSNWEDTLIHCTRCSYQANLELAQSTLSPPLHVASQTQVQFYSIPTTRTFLAVVLPLTHKINPLKLSKIRPDARPQSTDRCIPDFDREFDQMEVLIDSTCVSIDVENIFDRVTYQFRQNFTPPPPSSSSPVKNGGSNVIPAVNPMPLELSPLSIWPSLPTYSIHDIRTVHVADTTRPRNSQSGPSHQHFHELCPKCSSPLNATSVIEVGHTFYLGTKYSSLLGGAFDTVDPLTAKQIQRPFEMGCFGIGISRLVGAIAECCQTKEGRLRWPINVAPFKVCIIIPTSSHAKHGPRSLAEALAQTLENDASAGLGGEVLIDDRDHKIGWKLNDAELIGYPILVVIGSKWIDSKTLEIKNLLLDSNVEVQVHDENPQLDCITTPFPSWNLSKIKEHILFELRKATSV